MHDNFLVIGSNSFSGANFISRLLENEYEVMGVSRSEQINSVFLPYSTSLNLSYFQFHQININDK